MNGVAPGRWGVGVVLSSVWVGLAELISPHAPLEHLASIGQWCGCGCARVCVCARACVRDAEKWGGMLRASHGARGWRI